MTEGLGPDGVTHRCTLLTQGVHPTLFMLGPPNPLRKFPGPQVLTAWSRLTFGVSPSRGGSGLTSNPGEGFLSRWLGLRACAVVENPAHHGARIPSWPWALSGDSIPPPHSVGTGFSLEEGCGNVPHTGSWPFSDRGGISCLDISCLGTACSKPDWNIRYPLCAVRQVSFCWGPASILPAPPKPAGGLAINSKCIIFRAKLCPISFPGPRSPRLETKLLPNPIPAPPEFLEPRRP